MAVDWNSNGIDVPEGDEELPGQEPPALLPSWMRKPPAPIWWTLAFVCLAAVVVGFAGFGRGEPGPVAHAPSTAAPSSSSVRGHTDAHLELVRYLARHPGPLAIYIRSIGAAGACPLVEPGTSPQKAIKAAVHRVLPRFRITDVGYTLDPYSALCVLQIRARNGTDSILVINVVGKRGATAAPEKFVESAVLAGSVETNYAFAVTRGGWAVTVGSTGRAGHQPAAQRLRELAVDPAARW